MKRVANFIFSMKLMAVLLLVFAGAIAVATFIENDYGTDTARASVYNAWWFELLFLLLAVNFAGNIFRYRLWRKEKWSTLLFHLAFVVIIVGAALTRYAGYEGVMHIREGDTTNTMLSSDAYLKVRAPQGEKEFYYDRPLLLSALSGNYFQKSLKIADKNLTLRYKNFIPNAVPGVVADSTGVPTLSMMVLDNTAPQSWVLRAGEVKHSTQAVFAFDAESAESDAVIRIQARGDSVLFTPSVEMAIVSMMDQSQVLLPAGQTFELAPLKLYRLGDMQFVLREFFPRAKMTARPSEQPAGASGASAGDALVVKVVADNQTHEVTLWGGRNTIGAEEQVRIGAQDVYLSYGAKPIALPFALKLVDFQLERYPNSDSPSSYASEVIVLDSLANLNLPYRIYMNHILQHRGYRFFQSSYDTDEKGTILSVSQDPGTGVTYTGYFLLAVGFVATFFNRHSRFRKLGAARARDHAGAQSSHSDEKADPSANSAPLPLTSLLILISALFFTPDSVQAIEKSAQDRMLQEIQAIDYGHSRDFGELLVQDFQGRIKPVNTLAHEVLHKVARKNSLLGLHPDQVLLGMVVKPHYWQHIPLIRIRNQELNQVLGLAPNQKYAAYIDFFDFKHGNQYKLSESVRAASRKRPAEHSKLDKEIIAVDEKVNICNLVLTHQLLRIFPMPGDSTHTWYSPMAAIHQFPEPQRTQVGELFDRYVIAIDSAIARRNWAGPDSVLAMIKAYQVENGRAIIPGASHLKAENRFNELKIFQRLFPLYLLAGLVLFLLGFIKILRPTAHFRLLTRIISILVIAGFIVHTFGLGLRWFVSQHAPWSNGYESMIYIAWATILAGFIFARRTPLTLSATGILAGLILFVAHLSWMDPQITNLVPVLKSYWLTIHVSMITASYGFLSLGAVLGLFTLLLFAFRSNRTGARIEFSITELTRVNEMTLTVGLVLLTIGNFLGAIWANESWGRYWGWDPKETWALVTILVYSIVLHLRFIPSLRGPYMFNVAALLAIGSVLMTYFGVNYYLAGLHSYAKGDPVPVPSFVYYTVAIIAVVIAAAFRNRKLGADAHVA